MIAAGVEAVDGGGCIATEAIGFQPFAAQGLAEIAAHGFIEADHSSFGGLHPIVPRHLIILAAAPINESWATFPVSYSNETGRGCWPESRHFRQSCCDCWICSHGTMSRYENW